MVFVWWQTTTIGRDISAGTDLLRGALKAKGKYICERRDFHNCNSTLPQKTREEKQKAVLSSQNVQQLGKLNFVFNREVNYLT